MGAGPRHAFASILTALFLLADLFGVNRAGWTCRLIERLRPNAGHVWSEACWPPACLHCGEPRPARYR